MQLRRVEIVEDRSAHSRCDEGFLRVSRLQLRNHYQDGSTSAVYPCDVVSRRGPDAVVAVLSRRPAPAPAGAASGAAAGPLQVVLREALRAPIYLRRFKKLEQGDLREYDAIQEVIAGMLEPGDGGGAAGLCHRACVEAHEEGGYRCRDEDFAVLGEGSFASPGTSDEKVFYAAAAIDGAPSEAPMGDGSVMEQGAALLERELGAAIAACRSGEIPDMKTEVALLRLADHLGYIPQLGCFAHELPEPLRSRYRPLGVAPRSEPS
jgi:ADP-ribose pyrophosphatase